MSASSMLRSADRLNVNGSCPGRRWLVLTVVVVLGIPLGACTAGGSQPSSPPPGASSGTSSSTSPATSAGPSQATASSTPVDVGTVTIRDLSFGTPEIRVAVGVVTFVNGDDAEHTVTEGDNGAAAPNGRFDVFVDAGDSAEVSFDDVGDYRITCQFHPEMHLLVHAH